MFATVNIESVSGKGIILYGNRINLWVYFRKGELCVGGFYSVYVFAKNSHTRGAVERSETERLYKGEPVLEEER